MRAAFHNLGCKVNSYELDVVRQAFLEEGYVEVPFDAEADVYVINTCTVTNIADRKSRQMLHRARRRNPEAVVIALGCYVDTDGAGVAKDGAIDIAIPNRDKLHTLRILHEFLDERRAGAGAGTADAQPCAGAAAPRLVLPGRTRADIKIQDGCDQFCTYCIIPYARGRLHSRPAEEILEEVRGLAAAGTKEIVLSGIHISSYGRDQGERPQDALGGLLQSLASIDGISRIRIGSLEPGLMTEDFVSRIAGMEKFCPHFHMSLQSGCDRILKRMNRRYTTGQYMESCRRIRAAFDRPALTTDIIVGFPGETDEDFRETMAFAEAVGFYEVHVFKYSRRKGTFADAMPDQVPEQVKSGRSDMLLALTAAQAAAYRAQFIGGTETILAEEEVTADGRRWISGHTMRYVPCLAPAGSAAPGDPVRGVLRGFVPGTDMPEMEVR